MEKSAGTYVRHVGLDCEKCLVFEKEEREGIKMQEEFLEPLEGLVNVAELCGVPKRLADVAVGPLIGRVAVIGGVRYRVGALGLSGAVFSVMEVKAVADVTEQTGGRLLFPL